MRSPPHDVPDEQEEAEGGLAQSAIAQTRATHRAGVDMVGLRTGIAALVVSAAPIAPIAAKCAARGSRSVAPPNVITRHRSFTPTDDATLYRDLSLHRLAQLCPEQAPLLGQSCALRFGLALTGNAHDCGHT
jgi:hypothetical protein